MQTRQVRQFTYKVIFLYKLWVVSLETRTSQNSSVRKYRSERSISRKGFMVMLGKQWDEKCLGQKDKCNPQKSEMEQEMTLMDDNSANIKIDWILIGTLDFLKEKSPGN